MRPTPHKWTWALAPIMSLVLLPAARAGITVLPPHSSVEGRTIAEYTTDWWRWIYGFSAPNDPLTDPTGAAANLNQSGPVFFVAGAMGGTATRTFTVPSNKYILLPLLNIMGSQLAFDDFSLTEAEIRSAVNGAVDLTDELHASIDGVAVPNLFDHREDSPAFEFFAAPDNVFGRPTGSSGIAVSGGYWLMLAPIPIGETHVINFGGGISAFDFSVDVTTTITSVPEPSSLALGVVGALTAWGMILKRRRAV